MTTIGWLGTGRMGSAMARRLLAAGNDVTVWNRTRSKAEELAPDGAKVVGTLAELAGRDIVFVMVSTPKDLEQVLLGDEGLLSGANRPRIVVDCSTVSVEISAHVRAELAERGVAFLASPISGNPHVVAEGGSILVASGPRETFDVVAPFLRSIGKNAVYAGEGEQSRIVKLAHNLYLGLVVQSIVEVTVLAEKSGVPREAFLEFMNSTVLATDWVRKRTPDMLSLDWTPTFTTELLRKDFDLGLAAARTADVPMPLTASVHELLGTAINRGFRDQDFLALFEVEADSAGLALKRN